MDIKGERKFSLFLWKIIKKKLDRLIGITYLYYVIND